MRPTTITIRLITLDAHPIIILTLTHVMVLDRRRHHSDQVSHSHRMTRIRIVIVMSLHPTSIWTYFVMPTNDANTCIITRHRRHPPRSYAEEHETLSTTTRSFFDELRSFVRNICICSTYIRVVTIHTLSHASHSKYHANRGSAGPHAYAIASAPTNSRVEGSKLRYICCSLLSLRVSFLVLLCCFVVVSCVSSFDCSCNWSASLNRSRGDCRVSPT